MLKLRFLSTIAVALLVCSSFTLRADSVQGKKVHLHGTLIDLTCWNDRTGDAATLLREHTKRCLQMPDCIRSGYAVVTPDGKVYKLDAASSATTTQWIAATQQDANWRVDVKGRMQDGLLDVTRIQLQK